MKTATNTAQTYAETIAEELLHLETAATGAPYGFDPDDAGTDDDIAADYRDALTNLEMAHDTESPLDLWLNETALDLAILRDTRGNQFASRIEILRTCGGPTCYITRDTNDSHQITIEVTSGTETGQKRLSLPDVANYLDELADNQ
jgi:hypothetical protein